MTGAPNTDVSSIWRNEGDFAFHGRCRLRYLFEAGPPSSSIKRPRAADRKAHRGSVSADSRLVSASLYVEALVEIGLVLKDPPHHPLPSSQCRYTAEMVHGRLCAIR